MDKNTNNIFLIKWIGPFDSKDDAAKYEKERAKIFKEQYNLYLLQGKLKSAHKCSYYCGQTTRPVYKRLNDKEHHIHDIENRPYQIWIGRFANKTLTKTDINAVEKLIISELCHIGIGDDRMLNETNKKPPQYDVYVINQWYNWRTEREWSRLKKDVPAQYIPDFMAYNPDTGQIKGTVKIKSIGLMI